MNNKGFMVQAIIIIIMIVVLGAVIIGYYAYSLAAPFVEDLGVQSLTDIVVATNNATPSNLSEAAETAFQPAATSLGSLQTLSVLIFFGLILGFLITAIFVRTYPFLIVIWIIGIIILAFVTLFLSASYEDIKNADDYSRQVYSSWGMNDFILSNLPILVIAVGIFGALIMLFVMSRDQDIEQGGSAL